MVHIPKSLYVLHVLWYVGILIGCSCSTNVKIKQCWPANEKKNTLIICGGKLVKILPNKLYQ